jgi:hypothetical protein
MDSGVAMEGRAKLTAEQRLIGKILAADWSVGAAREWPRAWFQTIDWNKLPSLAWQHKIRPMTAAALREAGWPGVPAGVRKVLESDERECVTKAMQQVALLRDITAAANAQNLRVIVLKGVALSAHLYGDPFIREAFDLDILVHPDDVGRLDDLLIALGCKMAAQPGLLTPRQSAILERFHHDEKLVHEESGLTVDRHNKLDENPYLIVTNFDELWDGRSRVRIADYSVAILGNADLAHYLGIHAALHAWERWKWLADLHVLYRGEGLLRLREHAVKAGNAHLFNSWILLLSAITGAHFPPAIANEAARDGRARRLASRALAISSVAHTPDTIVGHRHFLRSTAYRFTLKREFKFILFALIRLSHSDQDWHAWRLSDRLIPLYFFLRPFLYAKRRLASVVRR